MTTLGAIVNMKTMEQLLTQADQSPIRELPAQAAICQTFPTSGKHREVYSFILHEVANLETDGVLFRVTPMNYFAMPADEHANIWTTAETMIAFLQSSSENLIFVSHAFLFSK